MDLLYTTNWYFLLKIWQGYWNIEARELG